MTRFPRAAITRVGAAGADPGGVLAEGDVPASTGHGLDSPMCSDVGQRVSWACLGGGQAGDVKDRLVAGLTTLGDLAFDQEHPRHVRKQDTLWGP
jgi:hypothetical protein